MFKINLHHIVTTLFLVSAITFKAAAQTAMPDHSVFEKVLKKYVDSKGLVSYKKLKKDREPLDQYIKSLGTVDASAFAKIDKPSQIAFYINAYNAITLQTIINHYPVRTTFWGRLKGHPPGIRHISGAWDKNKHVVIGKKVTLDGIEHEILRKQYNEPRIHMALVCAALGCPPLRNEAYTGFSLDEQLNDQTVKFISDPKKLRIDRDGKTVYMSKIFDWFGDDFIKTYTPESGFTGHSKSEQASLNFLAAYLSEDDQKFLSTANYDVSYLDYDWALNEKK